MRIAFDAETNREGGLTMTERQLLALNAPCFRAHESMKPDFVRFTVVMGRWVSTILTLNK